jgi:hypothetical protein
MNRLYILALFILVNVVTFAQSQELQTKLMMARKMIYNKEEGKAAALLREILTQDSTYKEVYFVLADIYVDHDKIQALSDLYRKASNNLGQETPEFIFLYGNTLYELGEMPMAIVQYDLFLKNQFVKSDLRNKAQKMKQKCQSSIDIMKKTVPFNPVNMGVAVNSTSDEYLPSFSVDESVMFITRKLPLGVNNASGKDEFNEDFFYCLKNNDGQWMKAENLGKSINTSNNEGAHCLSADGKTFVFTACNRNDSYGTCDLYISYFKYGKWTVPINMGAVVNSIWWDSQPSLSPDGNTLYFASNRKGTTGGTDIWYSQKDSYERWATPVNMGKVINSDEPEISPFIHPDGKTFYFASKGHPGVGGYDIFLSRLDTDGKWSTPVNIGYPINTLKDDMSLIVSPQGNIAYFSSERKEGLGGLDIYSFELYPEARPQKTYWVKGHIYDEVTGKSLQGEVELSVLSSTSEVFRGKADVDGNFMVCLSAVGEMAVYVNHKGYLFYSGTFIAGEGSESQPFTKEIPLTPIAQKYLF